MGKRFSSVRLRSAAVVNPGVILDDYCLNLFLVFGLNKRLGEGVSIENFAGINPQDHNSRFVSSAFSHFLFLFSKKKSRRRIDEKLLLRSWGVNPSVILDWYIFDKEQAMVKCTAGFWLQTVYWITNRTLNVRCGIRLVKFDTWI